MLPDPVAAMQELVARTYLVDPRLVRVGSDEVDHLARRLGAALPPDYGTYMAGFGQGDFCDLVHVYTPAQVVEESKVFQRVSAQMAKSYDLCEKTLHDAVPLAHTLESDLLLTVPSKPGQLCILPRHARHPIYPGTRLLEALPRLMGMPRLPKHTTFWPSSKTETLCYALPSDRFAFDTLIEAFVAHGGYQYSEDGRDEDTQHRAFYYRAFFGRVLCVETPDTLTVQMVFAPERRNQVAPLEACLRLVGFMDPAPEPTEAEWAEYEKVVYVTHNYHHLLGMQHLALCRTIPTPSQKRLAVRLLEAFADQIVWNRCGTCRKLKRTPRARQCFHCGTTEKGS